MLNFTLKMRLPVLFFFILLSFNVQAQSVQSMSFEKLQSRVLESKDAILILNFWATWCKPCIEELPAFEQINQKYSAEKIKVILINLDFNSKINSSVEPFVKNKKLQSEIIHITDTDPNLWINKIDSSWSGAIPATVIYNSQHQKIKFTEGQMTFVELESVILQMVR
jgi:thiol-disulfide isomerase/thioredoxin